ncbi:hypothetical protein [Pseudoruegeria sp. SHC-113]|uniref:hypothetical protein n=1 Tax=Pseudoruegeria sp. SHC-113 TaxID=2855439 RepID=UPI0021BA3DED|nr:hypothetical protein [Pseudoruegeria sp. SHC-113]MCT8160033.1 hypothetical protein [Pseudoruegeria sp. SHC-113]
MLKPIGACLVFVVAANAAQAFDRQTTNALKTCHDYLWQVPEFADLPNAAISVFPASENGDTIVVNWNVNWDQPTIQAAGNCTVIGGNVEGFEDYTK